MRKSKKNDKKFILKIKRASFFCLGLIFFLFPSQNFYSLVQLTPKSKITINLDNFVLPYPAYYPLKTGTSSPPLTTARSIVVMDVDSSVVIYNRNENLLVLPASTSKIMTALVALDYYPLEKVLVVGELDVLGQTMDLVPGEKIRVKDLLYGLLVSSANDAAVVLAQNYPGGVVGFVKAMNLKSRQLNLSRTYFANPTGLDSDKDGKILKDFSYTTSLDMARLAKAALKNPVFSEIVRTKQIVVKDTEGKRAHSLYNLNLLLGEEGVLGVKTGWTEEAGECLVTFVEKNGRRLIVVVLGSQDRFGETKKLINWVFENYQWVDISPSL